MQWVALASVVCATAAVIALWHGGRWDIGLAAPAMVIVRESGAGALVGVALIGTADLLLLAIGAARHAVGRGVPALELVAVFLPAAIHEELLFRGYPYQLIRRRSRFAAIASTSVLFAALHLGNSAITMLALFNILLGGVVLALGYEVHRRLWLPIGLHLAWNLMSGPLLGYEVSGYASGMTLLRTSIAGPLWLTGGEFGIEGSVVMTGVEAVTVVAFAALAMRMQKAECRVQNE